MRTRRCRSSLDSVPATASSRAIISQIISRINLGTRQQLIKFVMTHARKRSAVVVANINLHALYLALRDRLMLQLLLRSDGLHFDGAGSRMLAALIDRKCLQIATRCEHLPYQAWARELLYNANNEALRIAIVSGTQSLREPLLRKIASDYPSLKVKHWSGYFPESASYEVLNDVARWDPHITFVGRGMPYQEHFILQGRELGITTVWLPCGAWFEFYAGLRPDIPPLAYRLGFGWLYRLLSEPDNTKLWHRYMVEPWLLLYLLARGRGPAP